MKVVGQTVQAWERWRTDGLTDGRTDGRYQAHYLPASLSYAIDNYLSALKIKKQIISPISSQNIQPDSDFYVQMTFSVINRILSCSIMANLVTCIKCFTRSGLKCTWNLVADAGEEIILTFPSFRTESCCDCLNIYDGACFLLFISLQMFYKNPT